MMVKIFHIVEAPNPNGMNWHVMEGDPVNGTLVGSYAHPHEAEAKVSERQAAVLKVTNRFLASLSAAIEYTLDREGGLCGDQEVNQLTHVRYRPIQEVPFIDFVVDGRIVRVTAEDLGSHTHTFDDGMCDCSTCGYYDEEREDETLGTCSKCAILNSLNEDGVCLDCSGKGVVLGTFTGADLIKMIDENIDREG